MRITAGMVRRAAARGFTALMLTLSATGCSSILGSDEDQPEEARVVVTGTSPVPLLLITTTQFVFDIDNSGDRTARILTADTSMIELPVDRTYPFGTSNRFLVRVVNPDVDQTASIQLQLLIDGKSVFNDAATLRDASLQYTYVNP